MKQALPSWWGLVLAVWGIVALACPAQAQALHGTFAAGSNFALSIHADGTLWATGDNSSGQLGLGTTASPAVWTQVGSATDWAQVAAGDGHALGLRSNGTLWAWGRNAVGQLGDGSTTDRNVPVAVAGTYTQVAAGGQHSLALRADGTLWAWGLNSSGQLGDGTGTNRSIPTAVAGSTYTQVSAGAAYSLALRADGTVYAWGANDQGQLGDGTTTAHGSPAQVGGGGLYTQVAGGGAHALGLRDDGTVYAWGDNTYGQLGDGSTTGRSSPVAVAGNSYTQLAASQYHNLALRADGTLWAWGRNAAGQLGDGSTTDRAAPVAVSGAGPYAQVAAAGQFSLALQASGQLAGWGSNTNGQLGTGSTATAVTAPMVTGTALPTRSTAMGGSFGLAVRADGTLWAWGDNSSGQLARATPTRSTTPLQIGTDNDWLMVAAGTSFGLALKADGRLYGWGPNRYGQLGNSLNVGTNTPVLTPTLIGSGYTRIAAGYLHSLGLQADGTLLAWGYNYYGQLANPDPASLGLAPNPVPRAVSSTRFTLMAGGTFFSLGLRADGTAYGWGLNDRGQLGTPVSSGTGATNTTPLLVNGTLYTDLAAGGSHSLGLRADGKVYAWGNNASGQLGSTANGAANPTPSLVSGEYAAIAVGNQHSLARRADGTLWSWGDNSSSQLARPTTTATQAIPTQEDTGGTGWTTLATGSGANFVLVRTASGLNFASAGQNSSGQLGDGTLTNAPRLDRASPLGSLQPLPVQLVEFQAWRTGPATVQLDWTTASELRNAGFRVERSADGKAFSAVGFVAGAGTTPAPQHYELADPNAPAAGYYRLAQLDEDGSVRYSEVRHVSAGAPQLTLAPNPAHGVVQVQGLPAGATCTVYNTLGQPVGRPATVGAAGLSLDQLPAGVYIVQARLPSQPTQTARLVVQ